MTISDTDMELINEAFNLLHAQNTTIFHNYLASGHITSHDYQIKAERFDKVFADLNALQRRICTLLDEHDDEDDEEYYGPDEGDAENY